MKKLYLYLSILVATIIIMYEYAPISSLHSESANPFVEEKEEESYQGKEKITGTTSTSQVPIVVEGCNDGDTCKVLVAGLRFKVRLADIDAPEIAKRKNQESQPFAKQSRDRLNQLVRDKYVSLKQVDLDGYNRPIVEMVELSSNTLVNLKLVEEGLAEIYIGGRKNQVKDPRYIKAQIQAKKQKLGIWSTSNYMSPYEYRRLNARSNQ